MRAFGAVPVLMVTVFPAVDRGRPDPFVLASSFGLTPAEARVAVAAAEGLSDKQVARQNGTSLATVRTQLQKVYAKTGAARRADLVQLLSSSPGLWLGGLGSTHQ
jgi:DNA-binding CsgD family transcriptional regulator